MSPLGFLRTASAACLALACGSIVVTSCMTPEFTFDEDGGSSVGTGSSGNEGGNGGVTDHCKNRKIDAGEGDIDCGGIDCADCELGQKCNVDGDCVNGACTNGRCQDPSCTDDFKDGTETDVDCGGKSCGPCDTDQKCETATDCSSKVCTSGKCKAATCTDRKLNQNEVDVDCGGECQPCDVGDDCVVKQDCQSPADTVEPEANAQPACTDMKCALVCDDTSRGDCNQTAGDGCETNLLTDNVHCGACGEPCAPAHAMPNCSGGLCGIATCLDGYEDVDNDPKNGCEVNTNTDPDYCGATLIDCSDANGTPSCVNGVCQIACNPGFADCNANVLDGCEIDKNTDTKHCGACSGTDAVCTASGPTKSPFCADGQCGETDCSGGKGDCDGDTVCTDDLNTAKNCGTCGTNCTVANGTPACTSPGTGSPCTVGACDNGFSDCDGNYINGCEVDVTSNKFRCGGCLPTDTKAGTGKDCDAITQDSTKHVGAAACTAGGCVITGCVGSWADCDGAFANGCEIDTSSNAQNCGGCKVAAPSGNGTGDNCTTKYTNGNGKCTNSACEFTTCKTNFADCANGVADGCEVNTSSDKFNCGGCGMVCQTDSATATNTCSNGTCNPTCQGNGAKCDTNGYNGCEDRDTDANNCGACGTVCALDSVTSGNSCSAGSCVPMCIAASGGMSCDGIGTNGCEDTKTDANNCGACGTKCDTSTAAHVTAAGGNPCTGSVCAPVCATNYQSCDSNGANGCESNKTSDPNNCGGCGSSFTCANTNVGTRQCSSSTCNPICNPGWCPSADPKNGCTIPTGTKTNCGSCGDVCTGNSPFCGASGCEHRPIVVKNDTATGTKTLPGTLTVAHALSAGVGTNRAVVVGVSASFNNGATDYPTVKYNGVTMTQAAVSNYSTSGQVAIFYLLDAALPTGTGNYNVAVTTPSGWGSLAASVVELSGVNQAPAVTDTSTTSTSNCNPISVQADVAHPDSFVFAAAYSQGNSGFTSTPDGLTKETLNTFTASQNQGMFGYAFPVSANTTVGWTTPAGSCWTTQLATATFSPVFE